MFNDLKWMRKQGVALFLGKASYSLISFPFVEVLDGFFAQYYVGTSPSTGDLQANHVFYLPVGKNYGDISYDSDIT